MNAHRAAGARRRHVEADRLPRNGSDGIPAIESDPQRPNDQADQHRQAKRRRGAKGGSRARWHGSTMPIAADDHDSGRVSQRIPERTGLTADRRQVRLETSQADIGEHGYRRMGRYRMPPVVAGPPVVRRQDRPRPSRRVGVAIGGGEFLVRGSCRLLSLLRKFDQAQERGLIESRDDHVGVMKRCGRTVLVRNADSERPGRLGGGQACGAVFENQHRAGRNSEPLGRPAINLRVGLAAGDVFGREDECKPFAAARAVLERSAYSRRDEVATASGSSRWAKWSSRTKRPGVGWTAVSTRAKNRWRTSRAISRRSRVRREFSRRAPASTARRPIMACIISR